MNTKTVKKYLVNDPAQEEEDKEFWAQQSYEYKILVLESLRRTWQKMNPNRNEDGDLQGFRRVLRIAKQA